MLKAGYQIVGTDVAMGQVHLAATDIANPRAAFVTADGRRLPFRDEVFDFAYVIGSLHHIENEQDQRQTLKEMARIVRVGGIIFLHETNPRNPLFRFYMGYVFPVLRDIDVGSELWVDPRKLEGIPHLDLREVQYFSFLPDFLPAWLYRMLLPVEAWLERSRASTFSAHYMAVFQKIGKVI